MFNPSQEDVRRFFCAVHAKARGGQVLDALETLASEWLKEHPEYDSDLADAEAAVARVYDGSGGQSNPFLHLSMHLSIFKERLQSWPDWPEMDELASCPACAVPTTDRPMREEESL